MQIASRFRPMIRPISLLAGHERRAIRHAGSLVVLALLLFSTFLLAFPASTAPSGSSSRLGRAEVSVARASPFGGAGTSELAVLTNDSRLLNNTRLLTRFVLPSSGSLASGEVNLWLVEPLTEREEVGVGVAVNVSHGSVGATAEWGIWGSNGSSTIDVNRSFQPSAGTPVLMSIVSQGGGNWSLTVNGLSVPAGSGGLLDFGVTVADDVAYGGAVGLPEPSPTVVTTSLGPFPFALLSWTQAFGAGPADSPYLPGFGYAETSGATWGAAGQDQPSGGGPDAFNESASLSVLANGTDVWGIGNADFPPVAAWTSTDSRTFSTPGGALELTVPAGELPSHKVVGICQELLEPLANGEWITVGACWDNGTGVRAYMAVTDADGAAYQKSMYVALPSGGQAALLAVRDVGHGVWEATVNGLVMVDAFGNSSIDGGADLCNATMGPYGALRGYPSAALPAVLNFPDGILVYRSLAASAPLLPSDGRIADSDARPPALIQGHLQNATLPSGAIEVFPGRTPLPFQTPLWDAAQPTTERSWLEGFYSDTTVFVTVLVAGAAAVILTLYTVLYQKGRRKGPGAGPDVSQFVGSAPSPGRGGEREP
jgi:hypothetical protein